MFVCLCFLLLLLLYKNDTASALPSVRSFVVLLIALRCRMVLVPGSTTAPRGGGAPQLRRAHHLRPEVMIGN